MKSLSRVRLFATPWTVAYQAPPTMGFSRQECWSGLPFPSPGALPDPGIEPGSPALQADALLSEPQGRRGGKNTQKNNIKKKKKDINDPDNHDDAITELEPGILESRVRWALGSITMNKASGGDGIPVELFQILEMMLWKCCTQYANKFGKLSIGHRTGKGQFSFQSQRKAMPKNVQTTSQLHSSHTLRN